MKKMCIYIHIPYCKKRCYYCSFFSSENQNNFKEYFSALKTEIETRSKTLNDRKIESIYFGGGTPSAVPSQYIKEVMNCLQNNFFIEPNAEITLEANPGTLTSQKTDDYVDCKINRFSIGLQSANDNILKTIGRIHTLNDFIESIKLIKSRNINNISADIMLGLPNQTIADIEETLDLLLSENLPHISAYGLKLEKGTKLFNMVEKGEISLPDDDLCADMYDVVYSKLKKNNILRYEVSNFALKGKESIHNLNYWQRGEYAGFGTAAHSFINNQRFNNICNISKYIENDGCKICENMETLTKQTAEFEYIFLGLRLCKGINTKEFYNLFNADFKTKYSVVLKKLSPFLSEKNDNIFIKENGFNVLNLILSEFAP